MKSVSRKQKNTGKSPFTRNAPLNQRQIIHTQQSIPQEEFRRHSQKPVERALPNPKQQNMISRITNIKSDHGIRQRSLTPGSQASSMYMAQCENRYKQLEQIMKRQHDNIRQQNTFLQQEIRSLYDREAKYKQNVRRYKEQIKFLKLENQIYQQRYNQIKHYINSVVDRMAQLTVIAQEEDKELFRNSSLEMVTKLKEELSHYEDYNEAQKIYEGQVPPFSTFYKMDKNDQRNVQSQFFMANRDQTPINGRQDITNNFLHTEPDIRQIVDLQETRFIKDPPKYNCNKNENSKKLPHKTPTLSKQSHSNHISRQSQESQTHNNYNQQYPIVYSYHESSTPNSDSKTIDNNFKAKNFLQETSESNSQPGISQQIQDLTDQSEALMYELQKTNNQDSDIKKKIIRISQKIRQLKIEANSIGEQHKFTSLQNINSKQ